MRKRAFPPLPPLSPQALHDVEEIDHAVQSSLESCSNATGNFVNAERALRILRTCLVMSLDVQLDYYRSLQNYHPVWMALIVRDTIESFIGLFPLFTSGEGFRPHLAQ